MLEEIKSANLKYDSAVTRGSGTLGAKETLKNILFNYRNEIIAGLEEAAKVAKLQEDVAALEAALDDADKENEELRAKSKKKSGETKE